MSDRLSREEEMLLTLKTLKGWNTPPLPKKDRIELLFKLTEDDTRKYKRCRLLNTEIQIRFPNTSDQGSYMNTVTHPLMCTTV